MNNVILVSIITLIGILFWILISYMMKIWPFHKKNDDVKSKSARGLSKTTVENNQSGSGTAIGIFIFIIFMLFFVGIIFISFKITITRYKIAGEAIKQGNTTVAAAVMAPEIGQGINAGLSGLFRK